MDIGETASVLGATSLDNCTRNLRAGLGVERFVQHSIGGAVRRTGRDGAN